MCARAENCSTSLMSCVTFDCGSATIHWISGCDEAAAVAAGTAAAAVVAAVSAAGSGTGAEVGDEHAGGEVGVLGRGSSG